MREFEEHELRCGYAPRSMQYSLDSDTLFIGCKDETITIVTHLAARDLGEGGVGSTVGCYRTAERFLDGGRAPAVRALCECHPGWLLVGRDGGTIDLWDWREAKEENTPFLPSQAIRAPAGTGRDDRVSYLEWLDSRRLLVSFRRAGVWVVTCEKPGEGVAILDWIQGAFDAAWSDTAARLPAIRSVVGVVPMELDHRRRWLILSETGSVWVLTDDGNSLREEELKGLWPEGETPGFITDFAFVKSPNVDRFRDEGDFDYRLEVSRGAYLATDNGVYLLDGGEEARPRPKRMSLPGLGSLCIAITYYADEKSAYLWVSDSAGDAHLFRDELVESSTDHSHRQNPNWRRSGIRHDASQVVLAIASWRTLAGHFVVGQARRNDCVVISRYRVQPVDERPWPRSPAGPRPWHTLLQEGTVEEVRTFLRERRENIDGWEKEALLAELFEILGDAQESVKSLREFLGNPTADLALKFLAEPDLAEPERAARAIRVWTYALLGTVHHYHETEKESLYLGIIRWLRAIAGSAEAAHIHRVADEQILFVRKWGLFGSSYARRRSATVPLEVLLERDHTDARLDRYAYRSLVFQRQVDLESEHESGQMAGRTAWDLKTLSCGERLFVAVSWIWGGVELYEAVAESRAGGGGYRFDLCAVLRPVCGPGEPVGSFRLDLTNLAPGEAPPAWAPLDFGHCRALAFGRLPEPESGFYLLTCPAQRPDGGGSTRFELWRLGFDPATDRLQVGEPYVAALPKRLRDESVYSLLHLEPGLVLAGLRGVGGEARLVLVKFDRELHLECLSPQDGLPARSPAGKSIARNPVWALACEEASSSDGTHTVFAGCGDGQVWLLKIPAHARARQGFKMSPRLVERLGAPVWALACRTFLKGRDTVRRVFAGGADGTILAWQQLPQQLPSPDHEPRFTTVWATWEEDGAIARLHPLDSGPSEDRAAPIVLAVTQQGRCILFADREQIEETRKSPGQGRLRVPGERYGRLLLGASAFASDLVVLPDPLVRAPGIEVFTRLLTATSDGRLRLYTLHFPLHLPRRAREYGELVHLWLDMVRAPARNGGRVFLPDSFRMTEAAYVASPVAPQVLVRALLEPEGDPHWREAPDRLHLDPQWLPRYLRPLLSLHRAWQELRAEEARECLEQALGRAWQRNDRKLFVEILTVVLHRSNRWLFEQADRADDPEKIRQVYRALLEGIERSAQRWLGFPDRAEIRTLMSFAKQLADGDTLWRLGCGEASAELREVLAERIGAIRRLLVMGDPLLSLETLRATNLSLMRVCRRLVEDGGRGVLWSPGHPDQELPWGALQGVVAAISDFAAGAFHLSERVNDSLTHEIIRAYVLTVCACPSAAIRVAHWMSEADLVSPASSREDRAGLALRQIELLADLGIPVPPLAVRLFLWACTTPLEELDIRTRLRQEREQGGGSWPSEEEVGQVNGEIIEASLLFKDIVDWLDLLATQLSRDASGIDLWRAKVLHARLGKRGLDDNDPFRHSRRFWMSALGDFEEMVLARSSIRVEQSNRVQPEIVLLSRDVAAWCRKMLGRLERMLQDHEIFQPQDALYRTVLRRLEQAAEDFPKSSAIQKNIVLGILGHGLLESLDEHVLELEEVAQSLDPFLVWEHREGSRLPEPGTSNFRAEHFALYLLRRSQDAESIPKNLRTLQGLLETREADAGNSKETFSLRKHLLADFQPDRWPGKREVLPGPGNPGWIVENPGRRDLRLTSTELRFLRLTLKELDQNDRNYGPALADRTAWPRVSIVPGRRGGGFLTLRFPLKGDDENIRRLRKLRKNGLQQLIPRRGARDVASHGTGLYLANLAAAVVGWRLRILTVAKSKEWLLFQLEKVDTDSLRGERA